MSAQKYIIDLTFLIAVLLAINIAPANGAVDHVDHHAETEKSYNLMVGHRVPGDKLVLRQSIVKHSSSIIFLEKTFNTSVRERITLVQSLNQNTDGTGASVTLLRGGPNSNSVTLLFESQGHGINHIVELYAREF